MAAAVTKTADRKGRITLGLGLANRTVSIRQVSESEYVVKLVRVIPEDEAWLYENPKALAAVRAGLQQARAGRVTKGPDLAADNELVRRLKD